jgi:hypothetical protein
MNTTLLPPDQWAQSEFAFAQLGDKRRNNRLVNIAHKLAANPGGTLPQAFPLWKELKAAYRFFSSGARFDQIIGPHVERTQAACREPGEYLIIEDTTLLDYSDHPATEDLGHIGDGNGRGFELHSALAVRVEGWSLEQRPEGSLVGLFGQRCSAPRPAPAQETRQQRLSRPRKSQRWAESFKAAGVPPDGAQWIYIADCESDFYEPIETCQQHQLDFIIRAYHDRRLAEGQGHLFEALEGASVLGLYAVKLRSRDGEPARTAIVEIKATRVDLDGPWRPGGWKPPLKDITVLEVKEVDPPEGIKRPLHWRLLTSLPCQTLAQAKRIVGRYAARWWIEEYHKALKSGAKVEESQLERGYRLEPLIAVLAIVAVRLFSTKLLARSRPDSFEAAESLGPEIIELVEHKFGKPEGGWTNQKLLVCVARVGGFIGRKRDGMPGWQTIWRGWHRLMWMCEGLEILNESSPRCG